MEIILLLVIIVVGIGIFVLNNVAGKSLGNKKRCPRCGNYGVKPNGGGYYKNGQRGIDWICTNCGSEFFS